MIHTGIQMTPNNHILAERRGGGRTCNGEEEEEEEKQAAADARVFICARLVTCTRIRLHAYARMERDTQAQRRRGAPVVSLGEVPGVSLSGLLGPSLSFYPSNLRPFLFFLFNAASRSRDRPPSRSLSSETLFNYSPHRALNSRLENEP